MSVNRTEARLGQAAKLELSAQVLQAELLYTDILKETPDNLDALRAMSRLAHDRGDQGRALTFLEKAHKIDSASGEIGMDYAALLAANGQLREAIDILKDNLKVHPSMYVAWLFMGQLLEHQKESQSALRAYYEAVTRAQRAGAWMDEDTTPDRLFAVVVRAIELVRRGRKELLMCSYNEVRLSGDATELIRVDKALSGYLKEWNATPADPRQKPKFFYFPGLQDSPYHDPFLQPWAHQLKATFPQIRAEALKVWGEDQKFQNFLELSERGRMEDYVRGSGAEPSWEAFFFYRHGQRFDANHQRCPETSALLDSIELCRIGEQAPEICFSVLKPGTHLLPHYGVSNVRLVMHLPLIVPENCALNLVDAGEHHWAEGELVMFDDTYQHEAWNRSQSTRIVLLMDCWNPHLTQIERRAVGILIETITNLQLADRAVQAHQAKILGRP